MRERGRLMLLGMWAMLYSTGSLTSMRIRGVEGSWRRAEKSVGCILSWSERRFIGGLAPQNAT